MGKVIDETGNRYGRLTVLEQFFDAEESKAQWICKCDCGNETLVRGDSLRSGSTKSCGCLHTFPEGVAAFNALVHTMITSAEKRGYEWHLTKEQVRSLSKLPCYYCGVEPSQVTRYPSMNGVYVYNGLDRVDNNKGYTIDNVVPCCKVCNRAKGTATLEEFKEWVGLVNKRFYEEWSDVNC